MGISTDRTIFLHYGFIIEVPVMWARLEIKMATKELNDTVTMPF